VIHGNIKDQLEAIKDDILMIKYFLRKKGKRRE